MALTINCKCGQYYSVAEEYAGQQVHCPNCGALLTVSGDPVSAYQDALPSAPPPTNDPITVRCSCGQSYAAPAEYAGQQTTCPGCGRPLIIPHPASAIGPHLPWTPPPPQGTGARWVGPLVVFLILLLFIGALVGGVLFLAVQPDDSALAKSHDPGESTKDGGSSAPPPKEPPPRTSEEKPKEKDPPPSPLPPKDLPPPSSTAWQGHAARILALSFTPDGKSVLTAAGGVQDKGGKDVVAPDSTLRRWDSASGKEADRWPMMDTGIGAAAFSPDGRWAAVTGAGPEAKSEVYVWNLAKKSKLHTLAKHTKPIRCLAFSHDGRQLLSGGDDNLLILWDVNTGKPLQEMRGHTNAPNQVVFAPNNRLAISGGMDHTARIWDLEGGRQLHELTGHADIVWAVAFSNDSRWALTGCGMQQIAGLGLVPGARDHDIRLWDVETGKEQKRFSGNSAAVTALAFNGDGRRFLSGDHEGKLRLWQIESGKEIRRYDGHKDRVRAVAFFPTSRRALSGGEDGKLRTWALPADIPDLIKDLRGDDAEARRLALAELTRLGKDSRPAIPALFEALTRKDNRFSSGVLELLRMLSPLDKEHVARLDRMLQDRSYPEGRLFALDALAALGDDGRPTAKTLLDATSDKDVAVRRKAIKAVTPFVGDLGDSAFRPLLQALRDSDSEVSTAAETALGKLGAPAAEHLATLRGLLREDSIIVRRFGLRSLANLGETAAPALGEISERATKDSSTELRGLAIEALGKIAAKDRETIRICLKALSDREPAVCRAAAKVLAAAGEVPPLLKALLHADGEVVKAASEALNRVKYDKSHAPLLVDLLDSKEEGVRQRGIEALGKLGSDGAEGVPALCKVLKDAEAGERTRVLVALNKMGSSARAAGPTVVELLKNKDRAVRFDGCQTLIRIDAPEVKKAIPILVDALKAAKTEDLEDEAASKEREKARDLLIGLGKPAVPALLYALQNEFALGRANTPEGRLNALARLEVLKVLTGIGPPAGRNDVLLALAALERNDPFSGVRKAAREARVKLQRKE